MVESVNESRMVDVLAHDLGPQADGLGTQGGRAEEGSE
jgi:hypothetical protein